MHLSHKHKIDKGFELKTQQLFFILPIHKQFTNMLCQFFRLSWQFKQEKKSSLWKASFLENKNWFCVQNFVYNTFQLVKISLLISTMNNYFSF